MRKKKIVYVLLSILLLGALGLLTLWVIRINTKVYVNRQETKFKSIQLFDNNKFVLVAVGEKDNYGHIYYGQNYVSTIAVHSLDVKSGQESPPIEKDEFYKIISYDLNSTELDKKEIDLYSFINPSEGYRNDEVLTDYYGNGKDYFSRELRSYQNHSYSEKEFWFDVEKEKLSTEDIEAKIISTIKDDPYRNEVSFLPGGLSDSLENQLAKHHLWESDGAIMPDDYHYRNKIDISDTNFAQLYPEVAKNMKDMTRLYFRPQQYNQKEWFDNLLHWFAPKGQDVMEVYATDSATGEKTQIKSFDDYLAWREAHPEEVKKYEQ